MTNVLRSPYPDVLPVVAPSVIQSATAAYNNTTSATVTLGAAPTPGNLLITLHQGNQILNVTTLTGWTRRSANTTRLLHVHTRTVQAGDGVSYTWVFGTALNADVTIVEIAGQTTEVPRGLTDSVSGPAGTSHSFPFSSAPDHTLRVAAFRFNSSSPYTPDATWAVQNHGAAGASVNRCGVLTKPSVAPDIGSALTGTTAASSTPAYTTFAVE